MKALFVALVIAPLAAAADDGVKDAINSCDSAPAGAVVTLEPPYSSWFSIECDAVMKAHFAAAAPGLAWQEVNTNKSYRFSAYGPVSPQLSPLELNTYEPHKYHFVKAVPSVMTEQQLGAVNRLLPVGVDPYDSIHQLDLNTNTRKIYSFFIFLKDETPEWIVACVNYQCGRRATIQVIKK